LLQAEHQPHAINFPIDPTPSNPGNDALVFQTPPTTTSNVELTTGGINMSLPQSQDGKRFCVTSGVKKMLFRKVKFYDKRIHGEFNESSNTVCGLMLQWCNIASTALVPNVWWRDIQALVQKTHTHHRSNCIKAMRIKYRGTFMI